MEKIKLIAVVGPTASGKTDLAVRLALELGGEVVSCDSMQIYRHMPVATAVPTLEERRGVPHHMMEIIEPDTRFSVADYCARASECIKDIAARGSVPILCGGTGLYYSSLVDGIEFARAEVPPELRRAIEDEYDRTGGESMLSQLAGVDPETASRLAPADKKRIVRALELYRATGTTFSEYNRRSRLRGTEYDLLALGIDYTDRKILYKRIEKRVDIMQKSGIIIEARDFYAHYPADGTAAQAIGFKELRPWLDGQTSLEQAVESLKRQTRRYAKRQLTWFRRDERIIWLYADKYDDKEQLAAAAAAYAKDHIYGKH